MRHGGENARHNGVRGDEEGEPGQHHEGGRGDVGLQDVVADLGTFIIMRQSDIQ